MHNISNQHPKQQLFQYSKNDQRLKKKREVKENTWEWEEMCIECQNFMIKPQEKPNMKKINEQCNDVLKARNKRNANIYPEKIPFGRNTNLSGRLL
jgi:hypothetical protein